MISHIQVKNGSAELIHSVSLVTFSSDPVLVSFQFETDVISLEITFSDDRKISGRSSDVTVGSRKLPNGKEIGTLNFHNMLRAGEITPLDAFHIYSTLHKELFVTCDIKDPHKGRNSSPKYDHKTIIMSFWSLDANRVNGENHV